MSTEKTDAPPTMSFGKYKGQPVADVPTFYLKWVIKNFRDMEPVMMGAIKEECDRRPDRQEEKKQEQKPTQVDVTGLPEPGPIVTEMLTQMRSGFRTLAHQFHPEHGGNVEAFRHRTKNAEVDAEPDARLEA